MTVEENLVKIKERVVAATVRSGRKPETVTLIGVSKKQSVEKIIAAYKTGFKVFGENYAQEGRDKQKIILEEYNIQDINWHFIGSLQKNKVKYVVGKYDFVHSLDSLSLINEFEKQCERREIESQKVLIEVNTSGELSKGGFNESELLSVVENTINKKFVKLEGLMTMPPPVEGESVRKYFIKLRELLEKVNSEFNINLKHLSMGMSGDFEIAIEEGATFVRVGTAIFGQRQY